MAYILKTIKRDGTTETARVKEFHAQLNGVIVYENEDIAEAGIAFGRIFPDDSLETVEIRREK